MTAGAALMAEVTRLVVIAWEAGDGRRVLRPLTGPPGFARVDRGELTVDASVGVAAGTPASLLLVDPRGSGSVLLAGAIRDIRPQRLHLTIAQEHADGDAAAGPPPAFVDVAPAGSGGSVHADRLGARETTLLLCAEALILCARSPTERPDGPDGLALAYRTGRPGDVLVNHETSILLPVERDDPFWRAVSDLAGHTDLSLLVLSAHTGEQVVVTGRATILRRREHASRFPGADRAAELHVQAVRREPVGVRHLPAPQPATRLTAADRRPRLHRRPAVLSVNVGLPRLVEHRGRPVSTGIFKTPALGPRQARRLNLEGDGQADRRGHGGAFKALYAYTIEYYDYWAEQLGCDELAPGQFGENLTLAAMPDDLVHIGDLLQVGGAVLEISQPRVPCFKLGVRMELDGFEQRFLRSGRVGFYLRVVREGPVAAGDDVELLARQRDAPSVAEVTRAYYLAPDDHDLALRAFRAPALAHGWKVGLEERLEAAGRLP